MLPDALRDRAQWLVSGEDKAPRSVRTGRYADVRDASQYVTYDEAVVYAEAHGYDIGFALTANDPFAVIDLDAPENVEGRERHTEIFDAFDTYAELSRSGKGVHIWCLGSVPRGARRDKVEVYSDARYMICTGRVVKDRPVTDQKQLLDVLFDEIGRGAVDMADLVEEEALLSDAEVVEMGSDAVNGAKFDALWKGDWQGDYTSQSEADFALMNMLCFYSPSNEQCRRLFRTSGLGQRAKAQRDDYLDRMISKIRAEELPRVDVSALAPPPMPGADSDVASIPVLSPATQVPEEVGNETGTGDSITYPPGFVGELARYIYESSHRPVLEIAVAAALALGAGVVGRQFNVSTTGLNLYVFLIAETGTGKEGLRQGIERIIYAVEPQVPMVGDFLGPGSFASGQALVRTLDTKSCFVSVLAEFGHTLRAILDPKAAAYLRNYKQALLDLFTRSGKTDVLRHSAYADQENNTKTVASPAVTILGESTPESFFSGVSPTNVAEGLIPRFLIIEYRGNRPPRNTNRTAEPPEQLTQQFADLAERVLHMRAAHSVLDVQLSPEAESLLDGFDRNCDDRINTGASEGARQLWNRGHLKALRVSAVLAAVDRPHDTVISADEATWAISLVKRDIDVLERRFVQGDVGEGESKQLADLRRALDEYPERPAEELASYGVTHRLHSQGLIPHAYISRRARGLRSFRNARGGPRAALRSALQDLIKSGLLEEVPRQQVQELTGTKQTLYTVPKRSNEIMG